jgi:hypothetical protein
MPALGVVAKAWMAGAKSGHDETRASIAQFGFSRAARIAVSPVAAAAKLPGRYS